MQIGKNGLTKEFLQDIKRRFEEGKAKNIKVSVLRSARESREDVKKYGEVTDDVFKIVKKAIDEKKVEKSLNGPVAHTGFQRLT